MPNPMPEAINRLRRRSAQIIDQLGAVTYRSLLGGESCAAFNGKPQFALLTVNFHTTHYLKLMLLSLCGQDQLDLLNRIIIVDNGSNDGGRTFLQALAESVNRVTLIENNSWTNHARGMRLATAALGRAEQANAEEARANVLLYCDPDVIFLRPDTLRALSLVFEDPDVSHAGELRTHLRPLPEAQASFLAVRRDWAARKGISPWVNHGSPAWWLQRDLIRNGGKAAHFPGNKEGFILHRGRSAVAATRRYDPAHAYATARHYEPHFMGVKNGQQLWDENAERYAQWLAPGQEKALVIHLAECLLTSALVQAPNRGACNADE